MNNFLEFISEYSTPILMILFFSALILLLVTQRKRLSEFSFKLGKLDFSAKFNQNEDLLRKAGIQIDNGNRANIIEQEASNISERDAIIHSFASLEQIVKTLARTNDIIFNETYDLPSIVDRLVAANKLPVELAGVIRFLNNIGLDVRSNPQYKIVPDSRLEYQIWVAAVIDEINKLIILKDDGKTSSSQTEPFTPQTKTAFAHKTTPNADRKTEVGGLGFARPETGRPAASLYCIEGALRGQRFAIDQALFRLGASSQNHLPIINDDFVSAHHAYISFQQGNLMLFDDNSRNGTFLNGKRINQPMLLTHRDKIKLGGCTFELS